MTPIEQAAQALREAKAALTHPRDGWFDDRCNLALETVNVALVSLEAAKQEPLTDAQIVAAVISDGDPVWMRLTPKQIIAAGRAVLAAAPSPGSGT